MKYLLSSIIICILCTSADAQPLNKPEIEKRIDALFIGTFSNSTPGVAITVFQKGEVIARKNYGMANLEHNIPFTHQSPVRLVYSLGREFTCVGAAVMEAEGLLRFDDKVRSYFPKLPEWSKDVTIQDLLNHSSGFVDEWSPFGFVTEDMRSTLEVEQVLTMLYNQTQPEVEPGKGYMYNNTDIGLLRLIMEKASQQSLPDYLNKKLFTPLGMSQSFMNDNVEQVIPGFADDYYGRPPYKKGRFLKFSPGGNYRIVTTTQDLEKWALATEDKNSIVAMAYSRLYKNARPIPVVSPERLYVFGPEWNIINGIEVIKYGGLGDFYIARIPSQQISIVVLGNGRRHFDVAADLLNTFLPSETVKKKQTRLFPDKPAIVKKEALEKYTGLYLQHTVGYNSHIPTIKLFQVKLEGDSLALYSEYGKEFTLTPYGDGYFKFPPANAMIKFTKSHPDSAMKWESWREKDLQPLTLVRAENKLLEGKTYLQQYAGEYLYMNLNYYFKIKLNEQGQLIIQRPTVRDVVMIPHSKDKFIIEGKTGAYSVYGWITFTRNKSGEIDGFIYQDSRAIYHRSVKVELKQK